MHVVHQELLAGLPVEERLGQLAELPVLARELLRERQPADLVEVAVPHAIHQLPWALVPLTFWVVAVFFRADSAFSVHYIVSDALIYSI